MIIKKIRALFGLIITSEDGLSLEDRLFLSTIIIGIFASLLGSIVSITISSSLTTIIIALSLFFLLIFFYYFVKVKRIFKPFVIPVISISFIGISLIWVFDGGINGSDLFIAFVILILALVIVPEKTRKYIALFFITLIIIIYLLQLYKPELITPLSSEKVRWIDSLITALYSAFFIFLIIKFILKNYTIERLRAEENETKFRALSENSQDYITRFDRQHRYTYINQAGIEAMGVAARQILGKTPDETGIYDEKQSVIYSNAIEKVFTTKQSQFEQYNLISKSGINYYDWRLFPEFNDKNEVVSVLGVSRDITILKQSESKLLQLNADKDLFISILAHDLRNPFNTILGFSWLLKEELRTYDLDTIEKQVTIIHDISQKTYNLLDDLLLWARSQSGKLDFNPQHIDFIKTCQETIDSIRNIALSKNISLNCCASGVITSWADEDMIKIVLRNLVSNAIKFTNSGGQIDIRVEQTTSALTVSISDNGVGMAPDILDNLFNITHKITTTGTANEHGTGLGLLLCKEFIEKHNGKIWIESLKGKGSNVKFNLPIRHE